MCQALSVARQLGATTYVETSSRASGKGVRDAFEVAALAALGKLNKQQAKQQVSTSLGLAYNRITLFYPSNNK